MARAVCGPNGIDAPLAALAATHDGGPGHQVDVGHLEGGDLASPGAGLDHQPDQRLVAALAQVLRRRRP